MWGHATPQRPEPVWAKVGVGAPEVIAREVDMLPAERREVDEQRIRHRVATAMQGVQCAAEINGVPQGDGGREQGQAAGPVLLGLGRAGAPGGGCGGAWAVGRRGGRSRWKHTARASALRLSPLFSSAVACRLSEGCSSQSRVMWNMADKGKGTDASQVRGALGLPGRRVRQAFEQPAHGLLILLDG